MGGNRISRSLRRENEASNNSAGNSQRNSRIMNRLSFVNSIAETSKYKYAIPANELEIDRLHRLHYAWRLAWKTNFSAPMQHTFNFGSNVRVLDIGCGPGTWLLEMSSTYPLANFFGIDIVESFPAEIKPPNVQFIKRDLLAGLPFPNESFDLISMRNLRLAFSIQEWQEIILPELQRVLKPGGFLESNEYIVHSNSSAPSYNLIFDALRAYHEEHNIEINIARYMPDWLRRTQGLSNVRQATKSKPLGKHGGEFAKAFQDVASSEFRNLKSNLQPYMNINSKRFDNMIQNLEEEFEKECSSDVMLYRTWAQKLL
ncbi:hypothetical protein G9A89_005690 [Geosiphon pyriformis]|nr:hypothetical protein G9A89_005690 [Geosiphon pyriformis]